MLSGKQSLEADRKHRTIREAQRAYHDDEDSFDDTDFLRGIFSGFGASLAFFTLIATFLALWWMVLYA